MTVAWESLYGVMSRREFEVLVGLGKLRKSPLEFGHWHGMSTIALAQSGAFVVSVDHHRGDAWVGASPDQPCKAQIERFGLSNAIELIHEDFRSEAAQAAVRALAPYDLVFYDADHTAAACTDFWGIYGDVVIAAGMLAYDDADWDCMKTLGRLAEAAGFVDVTPYELVRGPNDKRNPNTCTIRVMELRHG